MIDDDMLTAVLKVDTKPKLRGPDAYSMPIEVAADAEKGKALKNREQIRLLLAHPSSVVLDGLSTAMRANGFTDCLLATRRDRMETLLKRGGIDILVVGQDMAGIDVFDMVAAIRRMEWGLCDPFLPIIVVMTSHRAADLHRAVDSGVDRLLGEPLVPADLIDRIERIALSARDFIVGDDYVGPEGDGSQGQVATGVYASALVAPTGRTGLLRQEGDRLEVPNILKQRLVEENGYYDGRDAAGRLAHLLTLRRSGVRLSETQRLIGRICYHGETGIWPDNDDVASGFGAAIDAAIELCRDGVRRAAGTEIDFIGDICRTTLIILKAMKKVLPGVSDRDVATLSQLNQCFSVSRFSRTEGLRIAPMILAHVEQSYGTKIKRVSTPAPKPVGALPLDSDSIPDEEQALTPDLVAKLDALIDPFEDSEECDLPKPDDLALPKELLKELKSSGDSAEKRPPFVVEIPRGALETRLSALAEAMIAYQFTPYALDNVPKGQMPPAAAIPFACSPAFLSAYADLVRKAVVPELAGMRSIIQWADQTLDAGLDPQSILFEICAERGTFVQGWEVAWSRALQGIHPNPDGVSSDPDGGMAVDGYNDLPPMPPLPGEEPSRSTKAQSPEDTAAAKRMAAAAIQWKTMIDQPKYGLSPQDSGLVSDLLFTHPPVLRDRFEALDGPRARYATGVMTRDGFVGAVAERLTRDPSAASQALLVRMLIERRDLAAIPKLVGDILARLQRTESRYSLLHGFHKRLLQPKGKRPVGSGSKKRR